MIFIDLANPARLVATKEIQIKLIMMKLGLLIYLISWVVYPSSSEAFPQVRKFELRYTKDTMTDQKWCWFSKVND